MLRLGLCCLFSKAPITFKTATATYVAKLGDPLPYISEKVTHNVNSLEQALVYCQQHKIGDFRIVSSLFPLFSHPTLGYRLDDLPDAEEIANVLKRCQNYAKREDIRLTFHPDQFVVLSASKKEVVESSLHELEIHAQIAEWVGADVINIHAGGAYGDKRAALQRLRKHIGHLSPRARERLTLENDDRSYTPTDLIELCLSEGIPFCYDVHHHHCLPDGLSIEAASKQAVTTWNREPLFHISSPKAGWKGKDPKPHHDFVNIKDFPACWKAIPQLTVEVEAKKKEVAVESLANGLRREGYSLLA